MINLVLFIALLACCFYTPVQKWVTRPWTCHSYIQVKISPTSNVADILNNNRGYHMYTQVQSSDHVTEAVVLESD